MTYATEKEVEHAEKLGYEVERSTRTGHSFQKGVRRVWAIRDGWQTADLIDNELLLTGGYFVNHQKFADLKEALERPIEKGKS